MICPSNPYISHSSSYKTKAFVGRSDIIENIAEFLKNSDQNSMFLYGQRCIGKTFLLRHVKNIFQHQGNFITIYFDLNQKAGLPFSEILKQIIQDILQTSGISELLNKSYLSLPDAPGRILPQILSEIGEKASLILLFDEFETKSFSQNQSIDIFYSYMKKLVSATLPCVKFIFALGRHTDDIDKIYKRLFKYAQLEYISFLSHDETYRLIRLSEKNNTLKWSDAQISHVWNITSGHPYFTQNLCYAIWEKIWQKSHADMPLVDFKDMGQSFALAMKNADNVFEWIWQGFAPLERVVISALAESGNKSIEHEYLQDKLSQYAFFSQNGTLNHIIKLLKQWGVIQAKDNTYHIHVNMLCRWITARKPFERIQDELKYMSDEFVKTACQLSRKKQLEDAVYYFQQAAKLNPDHPKVYYLLAKTFFKQDKIDETVNLLEPIYETNFPSVKALFLQALIAQADKVEQEDEKIKIYEKILNIQPGHPQAKSKYWKIYETRGDKAYEEKDFYEALFAYEKAGAYLKVKKVAEILQQIEIDEKIARIKKKKNFIKKIIGGFVFLSIICFAGLFSIYAVYRHLSEDLPRIYTLKDYQPPVITTIYSDDNQKIGEFYKQRRIVIPLINMSPLLIKAFISAEDSRFFSHEGVDFISIIRAFLKNVEAGTVVQGGSTITQQVIKSFLLSSEKTYKRKIKEAILAYRIDKSFSKQDILFLYLNQIYLGYGAYGVEAAAENYFGKSAKNLNLSECAMLAGLAKAPSQDSPASDMKKAKIRQKYVLNRMVNEGYITHKQAQEAYDAPLNILPRKNWYLDGAPFYTEYVRQYIEEKYGSELLYNGGLKIYTSVNTKMQKTALQKLEKGINALEKRHKYPKNFKPQGALLCMEVKTGYVRAMVGGRDFKISQFNRAVQACRQPGSAFKPIIYAAALDKGYTPISMLYDTPVSYPNNGKLWSPKNYDHKYYGPLPLRKALAKSRNVPAVRLLNKIGVNYAVQYAHKLGINSKLDKGLALALGASGVSLLELVNAYSVFASQGKLIQPVFITKIIDRFGRQIQKEKLQSKQVIEESTAFLMTSLLQSVVKHGTGYKIKKLNRPAAGKTGTTNDFRDAWFIGYTPDYITGTWVGFDIERSLGKSETGSRAASPIWLEFMQELLKEKPVKDFKIPDKGIVYASVDMATGLLPIPESSHIVHECFKDGTQPRRYTPAPVVVISEPEDFFKTGL